jgi:hypothetical protein
VGYLYGKNPEQIVTKSDEKLEDWIRSRYRMRADLLAEAEG